MPLHALFHSLNTTIEPKDLELTGLGGPQIPMSADSFCKSAGGCPMAAGLWLMGVSPASEAQRLLPPWR